LSCRVSRFSPICSTASSIRPKICRTRGSHSALGGQVEASGLADEQFITQVILQPGDLPAHCALSDVQLLGGPGEVAALRGDQKCAGRAGEAVVSFGSKV
jgi:hypothetical protein